MKSLKSFLFVTFLASLLFFSETAIAQERQVNWDAFSINLTVALKSGHRGLRQSAMQRIIQYGDSLNMEDGVYYMGRIFCYGTDTQERRLALAALDKINSLKAMAYIYQGLKWEDHECIKKQGCCALNAFYTTHLDITEDDLKVAFQEK